MIANFMGASYKRRDALLQHHYEKVVEKLEKCEFFSGRGKSQEIYLARPSDTQWSSYHTTLLRMEISIGGTSNFV